MSPTPSVVPAGRGGGERSAMTELGIILGISVIGLAFAGYLIRSVLALDTGTPEMRRVSDAIRSGAEAFLRRQNKTIASWAAALACLLFLVYAFVRRPQTFDPAPRFELA